MFYGLGSFVGPTLLLVLLLGLVRLMAHVWSSLNLIARSLQISFFSDYTVFSRLKVTIWFCFFGSLLFGFQHSKKHISFKAVTYYL